MISIYSLLAGIDKSVSRMVEKRRKEEMMISKINIISKYMVNVMKFKQYSKSNSSMRGLRRYIDEFTPAGLTSCAKYSNKETIYL